MNSLHLTIRYGGVNWSNCLGSDYNNTIRSLYRSLRNEGVNREMAKYHCVVAIHYT